MSEESLTWDDVDGLLGELKAMARGLLAREARRPIQTTGLVLSALRRQKRAGQEWHEVTWENRRQFFAQAYKAMRRALVDYSRQPSRRREHLAANLASEFTAPLVEAGTLTPDNLAARAAASPERAEAVERAIEDLHRLYPEQRLGEIVEHYFFGALDQKEIAEMLGVSDRTVRTRLVLAQGLLAEALESEFPELRTLVRRPKRNA
jgi:RNA polymerase sigma factor (sigma-70 family)